MFEKKKNDFAVRLRRIRKRHDSVFSVENERRPLISSVVKYDQKVTTTYCTKVYETNSCRSVDRGKKKTVNTGKSLTTKVQSEEIRSILSSEF